MSALDRPLAVTFFPDRSGTVATRHDMTLRALRDLVLNTHAPTKSALPLLKLATFGDQRTEKNSLRNKANVLEVYGVEVDYDQSRVTPAEAAAMLRRAGLAALIYTSPSHMFDLPRWRVLCPCSVPIVPDRRAELTARLNGVLGGIAASESFRLSQAFYFGCADHNPDHEAELIEGKCIDLFDGPPLYPVSATADPLRLPPPVPGQTPDDRTRQALATAAGAFGDCPGNDGRHQTLLSATRTVAPFVKSGHADYDDTVALLADAMTADGREPNADEVEHALDGALMFAAPYEPPTGGTEFGALPELPPIRRKLFTSKDYRLNANEPYIIKHLIAPGNVCALLGQPGAGKSTLAPHLAYAIAQGRPVFGMRTTPGRTLYIAAEDLKGVEKRVGALGIEHGHTDDCAVTGCGNLLEPLERAKVVATVTEFRPALVILDTLAAAFAGMDENSSQDMGRVVEFARSIAATGPAVLLIHHPAKAGDGSPRGSGVLNGTLDMTLTLAPDDVHGPDTIVRGRPPKNRNGTTAREIAFRKQVINLGVDSDGDAITTTLPLEIEADAVSAAKSPRLTSQQSKALQALNGALSEGQAIHVDGRMVVREADWRAACDARALTTSDKPDTQGRTFRRAAGDLVEAKLIT